MTAQGDSPAATAALEKLCRSYWRPLYAFIRGQGYSIEEAEDLTQSFFEHILERKDLNAVRREKGRLRSYLLVSLKHFLANEHCRAGAVKRGRGQKLIQLDNICEQERFEAVHTDNSSADKIYERRWASAVLDHVLARLAVEYEAAGNPHVFLRLKELLADEPGRASQAEIACDLGMTENAVKQALHRFRVRYRQRLREEIAQTVLAPGDVEDELKQLIAILRS